MLLTEEVDSFGVCLLLLLEELELFFLGSELLDLLSGFWWGLLSGLD